MTPEPDPNFCRRCWTREEIGLGKCSKHQEDRGTRDLQHLEEARDALAEGVHAKETRKPPQDDSATSEEKPA